MNTNDRSSILRSSAVIVGLVGIVAVHAMDLTGKMEEVPYLGFGYLLVMAAAIVLIERIIRRGTRADFAASAALAAAVFLGYIVNRTVGMPGAMDDIGNWWEPLGLTSLIVEGWVIWQGIAAAIGVRTTAVSTTTAPATAAKVPVHSA